MIPPRRLFDIFNGNQAELIDKWEHYFEVYERYFERFVGQGPRVLEIGVSQGGSLKMWSKYFGPDSHILGMDIDSRCAAFAQGNVDVVIGDQSDSKFLQKIARERGPFDIVIDDGGHRMEQQITSFKELLPFVAEHGIYMVEDLHTSYWAEYGGGLHRSTNFIEFSKKLIDQLNGYHIRGKEQISAVTKSVYSIAFYDSLLVVEKRPKVPPRPLRTGKPSF